MLRTYQSSEDMLASRLDLDTLPDQPIMQSARPSPHKLLVPAIECVPDYDALAEARTGIETLTAAD